MTALALEDFSTFSPETLEETERASGGLNESDRMAAYEQGYKAGWDDAVKTEAEEQSRIGAELANNLQEMTLSFHEAKTHVVQGMAPLLHELVNTLLPSLIRESLGQKIIEVLEPLVDDCAESPIHIVVASGCGAAIKPKVDEVCAGAIELVEENTLADGQAYLRVGQIEKQVDLSGALEQITSAIRALSQLNERALEND